MSDNESSCTSDVCDNLLEVPKSGKSKSGNRVADLRRQRGSCKSRLRAFETFCAKFADISLDVKSKSEFKLRTSALEKLYDNFDVIQSEIEKRVDEKDLDSQLQYRESFEEQYYSALATAKCRLVEDETNVNYSKSDSSVKLASVKLPEIKLSAFSGSYDQWLEFKNSFDTLIHKRSDLDAIQKFHYLRSALSGSALQVISALEFTAANYTHAWDLLLSRFQNNRLLIQNHIKSLFSIQIIQHQSPLQIKRLIDTVNRNLRALKTIGEPVDTWDTLIIYLIVTKLDSSTQEKWENHIGSISSDSQGGSSLKLNDLLSFLKNIADTLEIISGSHAKQKTSQDVRRSFHGNEQKKGAPSNTKSPQIHSYVSTRNNKPTYKPARTCAMCQNNHSIYTCILFLNLAVRDRIKFVEDKNLCPNCLRVGHSLADCTFGPCRQCQQKHNGLLHLAKSDEISNETRAHYSQRPSDNFPTTSTAFHSQSGLCTRDNKGLNTMQTKLRGLQPVLLGTALVEIADADSTYHLARALLDSGSQHCFITERLCEQLELPIIQSTVSISGIGQTVNNSNQICEIEMRSNLSAYSTDMQCIVLPCIATNLPCTEVDLDSICIPIDKILADPTFHVPSQIDLLIGADKFWDLVDGEKIKLPSGPFLQSSKLGWLISGRIDTNYDMNVQEKNIQCYFSRSIDNTCDTLESLDTRMKRFWEIEEIPNPKPIKKLTADELECEKIFTDTTKRDTEGRFIVDMPLKEPAETLGESFTSAKKRFLSLEKRLERLPEYKKMYSDFINEYVALGHMSKVDTYDSPHYFLPHHGVYKEDSLTTKLRVVFDASAKTTSNKSLNDIQYTGPILQNDIFDILLRFRQYKYVVSADITMMFRQIMMQPDKRNLQLIIWREKPSEPLGIYKLNTVTYGTSSAPYLSMRCLKELGNSCNDPEVSKIINEDMFVDDLVTGCDDIQALVTLCERTSKVLLDGKFPLRKWTFNFDVTSLATKEFIGEHQQNKTLGLGWKSHTDELHFVTKINNKNNDNLTKRLMLSLLSQIYDPLGLLAPIVITLKIILQKLWLCKIGWDDPVPRDIVIIWNRFINKLDKLKELNIPRFVRSETTQHTELHIFSDASQDAYGACAYVRTYDDESSVTVKLLCAKSKVSPLKAISIPRLELCGALVGAKLYERITKSLRLKFDRVCLYTDSRIVLGWLRMSPHLLKQFVQNRVTEINELTGDLVWRHVNGKENPADLLSRGLSIDLLCNCTLWWNGPSFLENQQVLDLDPGDPKCKISELPELKKQSQVAALLTCKENLPIIDFERYSKLSKIIRVIAYIYKFVDRCRAKSRGGCDASPELAVSELLRAERSLVIIAQKQMFPVEYHTLSNNLPISDKKFSSSITALNLFMDDKVIRVGGRLCNASNFSYNKKHPILLSSKHRFTLLLFRDEHIRLLHAGPQLLLGDLRESWWPLGGRNLARMTVRQCVTCARIRPKTLTPIMGNLPSERLHPGYPFMYTGVDYAGPVSVLTKKGRGGGNLIKGYICLFVCFVTRAIHLELVSGLSAKDYILALKRFISRRGKPVEIHSDNGRNFVGAEKEMHTIFNTFESEDITNFASKEKIHFRFIVPYSPHSGGLWESGVKSCKFHLRRIVGNSRLTFEEFTTALTLIEAVLNSRPLSPLSSDPVDLTPLTPAHFLIGRPLTAPACENLTAAAPHRLLRYDRVEQLRQHFWQRWAKEYVAELQTRTKWKTKSQDLQLNTLVLVKEDNLPPLKWRLGRVKRTYPGRDGVSRIADVQTENGLIQRTFAKICPLPIQSFDGKIPEDIGS